MKIKNKVEFLSFSASAAVVALFLANGITPIANPIKPTEYVVERSLLTVDDWKSIMKHPEFFYLGIVYVFGTSGSTITLPTDFVTTNNTIYCIGAGKPGFNGSDAFFCNPPGCSGGSGGGCAGGGGHWADGIGGSGGGGGACGELVNYSLHAAGQNVPVLVGAGNTWFHSNTTCLGVSAGTSGSNNIGGAASLCKGTTKISGNDGAGVVCPFIHGGAGGAAGGPTAFGSNPGAGTGGAGAAFGVVGTNGNPYGGGGGGGSGGSGPCGLGTAGGSGYQGLIAIAYTPIAGSRYYFFPSAF